MQNKPACSVTSFGAHLGIFEQALRSLYDYLIEISRNIEPGLIVMIFLRLSKFDLGLALPRGPQLSDFLSISLISAMTCSCGKSCKAWLSISFNNAVMACSKNNVLLEWSHPYHG
ncbi:MAG: hypothetical protein WC993_12050 [Methanoculleus sp.]